MEYLATLAAQVPKDQVVLEIGVYHAANLCSMARAAKDGLGAICYGVDSYGSGDIYRGRPHMLHRYTNADHKIALDNIRSQHLVRRAKLIIATSTEAAATWDGPEIGLLVIDGEHREHAVLNDFNAWQPYLAPGAIVAFDDYEPRIGAGVITAVDQLVEAGQLHAGEVIGTRLYVTRAHERPQA